MRIDSGVRRGDEISRFYDPMLAKLIAAGADRAEALRRLGAALEDYRVVGVTTNVSFLRRLIAHPSFAGARVDTGLIARHQPELLPPRSSPSATILAVAALAEVLRLRERALAAAQNSSDPWSPWHAVDAWWLNSDGHGIVLTFASQDAEFEVGVQASGSDWSVTALGKSMLASARGDGDRFDCSIDGMQRSAQTVALGDERQVFYGADVARLRLVDPLAHAGDEPRQGGHLAAPISGTIVAVLVKPGDAVAAGAPLLVLEAMKMEHTIVAPAAGKVAAIHFEKGDQVTEGADLIDVATEAVKA